jgi:hypothetical protein
MITIKRPLGFIPNVIDYNMVPECPDPNFEEERGYSYTYYTFDIEYNNLINLIDQCQLIFARNIAETMAFKNYNISMLISSRIFGTNPTNKIKISAVQEDWLELKNYQETAWFYTVVDEG